MRRVGLSGPLKACFRNPISCLTTVEGFEVNWDTKVFLRQTEETATATVRTHATSPKHCSSTGIVLAGVGSPLCYL